ncbi:FGGY family carbohydrate kinase [Gulosibacter molinativorax]|uniref:FGGY family carbohydrate kinase n=1 Tax=Gulosibacter molinativorax TaxID=256821 RepID=UPI0003FD0DA1|nr:FGGY family carbohydrate kinase [Gulosibacter molinativorax]QUY61632.1 Putative xylulokinase [Gulosibacter molinativorax]
MRGRGLVAGIDSSTQSCKVTVRDIATGEQVREGKATHPTGTIVHPHRWWGALLAAVRCAGGLEDVLAVSVSGQQHTPIFLDTTGHVVRESPLWNDTGSHAHMVALNNELGKEEWIKRTGLPITLSDTVSKLRWLRDTDPASAARTAAVAVVHDWLTWRLLGYGEGATDLTTLTTDRSEASGTGYWSPDTGQYCMDLVEHALGRSAVLPRILGPHERAGVTADGIPGVPAGIPIGVGSGDNAAAALALGIAEGDAVMSLGTSGVVYLRSTQPVHDLSGYVSNYADASGGHLPLVATLNAGRNFDAGTTMLGCTHAELSKLALHSSSGAEGLTMLPFFEGERTPDLPTVRASLHGASLFNFTRENMARAIIEGTLVSQVAMLDALASCGLSADRLLLIGGAAPSPAVQTILTQMVDMPVVLPAVDEYVTRGAALQAACALEGDFPSWPVTVEEMPPAPMDRQVIMQHAAAMSALGYTD